MADDADITAARMEIEERMSRPRPFALDFRPGDCRECGVWDDRLVGYRCCDCREMQERRARG
jgi:predicted Zn-ribbon and HTH transcriptional regulator